MSPEPDQLGRDSLQKLKEIIKPSGSLISMLNLWMNAAGEKVGGESTLTGFIIDGKCIHPILQMQAGSKKGLFTLGGEQCNSLFLLTQIKGANHLFSVDWGGKVQTKEYRVTVDGLILGKSGLELVRGDYSGCPSTVGAVLFPEIIAPEPLNDKKISSLFPYSTDKKACVYALWQGLQRAAGSIR